MSLFGPKTGTGAMDRFIPMGGASPWRAISGCRADAPGAGAGRGGWHPPFWPAELSKGRGGRGRSLQGCRRMVNQLCHCKGLLPLGQTG